MMTSRERIRRAINFQEADRVPIDISGMRSTGIAATAYGRLKAACGLDAEPPHVYDTMQMLAEIEEPVRQRLGVDVIPLESRYMTWRTAEAYGQWSAHTFWDGSTIKLPADLRLEKTAHEGWFILDAHGNRALYMPEGAHYFDSIPTNQLTFTDAMPALESLAFRHTIPEEELEWLAQRAQFLHETTEYAIMGCGYGAQGVPGIGFEDWMCLLVSEPGYCHDAMALAAEASVDCFRQLEQAVGAYVDIWMMAADDMGTQRGEYVRPDITIDVTIPYYRTICQWFRTHSRMKTFLHSCGSIYHLIDPLIQAGLDILNPIQTSAANMEPERLQREFGGRLVFWGGGCDTQTVLGTATPAEIDAHVRERIALFAPGGGFVFTPVHNVQANVPAENIIACYEAALKWGQYPITDLK